MIHPDTELRFISTTIGWGVVATASIPKGTLTWVLDELDHAVSADKAATLPLLLQQVVEKYAYVDIHRGLILCWDHARFTNHSCDPSCTNAGKISVANRDIQVGEQLTEDYGSYIGVAPFPCACESNLCRGTVRTEDAPALLAKWETQRKDAFALMGEVRQPLWDLVEGTDVRSPHDWAVKHKEL
jgi:hypothetical protein